jgi:hypothetical protein
MSMVSVVVTLQSSPRAGKTPRQGLAAIKSSSCGFTEHENLQFVVKHQHQSTTSTTEDVGEGSLEEGSRSFLFGNLGPGVQGSLVHNFSALTARLKNQKILKNLKNRNPAPSHSQISYLHHKSSTNSVEWIGCYAGNSCHNLSDDETDNEWSVLRVWQHALASVEETKVRSTVNDDTCKQTDQNKSVIFTDKNSSPLHNKFQPIHNSPKLVRTSEKNSGTN